MAEPIRAHLVDDAASLIVADGRSTTIETIVAMLGLTSSEVAAVILEMEKRIERLDWSTAVNNARADAMQAETAARRAELP